MKYILALTFFVLMLFNCAGADVETTMLEETLSEPVAIFTVRPENGALHLTIETVSPVEALLFEDRGQGQRRGGWTINGDIHNFDGVTVSRKDGTPLQRVEFTIVPEAEFFRRRYFSIDRIGESGWLFYKSIFALEKEVVTLSLIGFDAQMVRDGDSDATGQNTFRIVAADDTLLYIGPEEHLRFTSPDLIAGPEVPEWLRDQLSRDLSRANETLIRRLGGSGQYKPTVYVSYFEGPQFKSQGWKGGAMDEGVIALRLRNMTLDENDVGLVDAFTGLIIHEATHMWIGVGLQNSQNEQQSWASEGTTEYVSDRLRLSPDAFRIEAEETLNRCMAEQGERPLDGDQGYVHGRVAYDCGFVISLFAELGAARQGKDILDIWSDMFDAYDEKYEPEDFLTMAAIYNPQQFPALAARLHTGEQSARWSGISEALAGLPISLDLTGTPGEHDLSLNAWWLSRAMKANCRGSMSIYSNSDYKRVEGKGLCEGKWNANFDLAGVDGVNMFARPRDVYFNVQKKCAEGGTLTFDLKDGSTLADMPCGAVIEDVPPYVRITRLTLPPITAK